MARLLLRPTGAWIAVPVAFGIGVIYGLSFLGLRFPLPDTAYWMLPEGYSGGLVDSRLVSSGYFWFQQDAWRWPLLHIAQPNGDAGANAALMDVVPVLALVLKALRSLVGPGNPYGWWVLACFGLNAAALAALVRGLGQGSLAAACAAGALGALMPLVHLRFGHFALCAQWTVILPLAVYAAHGRGTMPTRMAAGLLVVLSLVAFGVAIYLYVMAAAVAAAFMVQAAWDRRMGWVAGGFGLVLVLAAGAVPLWAFGLLGGQDVATATVPFGYASMNLLSPFWPQSSGLFAESGIYVLTRGVVGGTPGQYEGYAYLGGGTLLLLLALVLRPVPLAREAGVMLRRHPVLLAALLVLTLWALSNQVYLGDRRVLSYPLPDVLLNTVLAWFRASGRFFWPTAWLLTAVGLAGVLRFYPVRVAWVMVVVALGVQWVDLGVWRDRLHALVSQPPRSAFGSLQASAAVEAEIGRRGEARVIPALSCSDRPGDYNGLPTVAGIEMQLLAARQDARMPSIVLARTNVDCALERATPVRVLAGPGLALVLAQAGERDRREEARRDMLCREAPPGLLCVAR